MSISLDLKMKCILLDLDPESIISKRLGFFAIVSLPKVYVEAKMVQVYLWTMGVLLLVSSLLFILCSSINLLLLLWANKNIERHVQRRRDIKEAHD